MKHAAYMNQPIETSKWVTNSLKGVSSPFPPPPSIEYLFFSGESTL